MPREYGLNADPENLSVAIVGEMGLLNLMLPEISGGQGHLADAFYGERLRSADAKTRGG